MKAMGERILNLGAGVVVLCAVVMTGVTVRAHLAPPQPFVGRQPPEFVEDWQELARAGHRIGLEAAPVTVMVFSDFECPMCARFATETYPDFRDRYPGETALVYRHWPLSKHRFSYPAARAAECAAAQGYFTEFHDRLYAAQPSLGLKTFTEFAIEAGVPDSAAFSRCVEETGPVAAIERDIQVVRDLGGTGTPTVLVNGWLLRGGVDAILLDSIAKQFLLPRSGSQ